MGSKLKVQSNVERIYQSIEEVHALISDLEEQLKLGLFVAPSEIEAVEIVASEEKTSLEDGSFLTCEF